MCLLSSMGLTLVDLVVHSIAAAPLHQLGTALTTHGGEFVAAYTSL